MLGVRKWNVYGFLAVGISVVMRVSLSGPVDCTAYSSNQPFDWCVPWQRA